jgi:hypothetical protein
MSLTGVTDDEYGPSVTFEPYPCPMPGCQEDFKSYATVLDFYLHMEEDSHATWLFTECDSQHLCLFGCQKGFINEHSLLRHYFSPGCQGHRHDDDNQHVIIQQCEWPLYGHPCRACKLEFASEGELWNHITDPIQHYESAHIATVLQDGMSWSIPEQYAPLIPTRNLLRSTYKDGHVGQYLIFIYRSSSTASLVKDRDKDKDHITRHCRHFIRYMRQNGQLRGKISFVVIRATVKSALLPCLVGDIDLEISMATSGLPMQRSKIDRSHQISVHKVYEVYRASWYPCGACLLSRADTYPSIQRSKRILDELAEEPNLNEIGPQGIWRYPLYYTTSRYR